MSLDEEAESELYAATRKVAKLPWKSVRERAFKECIRGMMVCLGWTTVTIIKEKEREDNGNNG